MSVAAIDGLAVRGVARRVAAAWHRPALLAIVALSSFLNLWDLGQNGYANTYYAAAVRSMLGSWSSFVFVAFDPGGLETVDKPPLALWLQALSAKAFGYSGLAMLVPGAIAGVLAVVVLYALVARFFGRVAGLVAALALAVSPVSVAVNRDNNPDALFVLLLVVAAYAGARAVEGGRLRWLLAAAAAVGLAFETKMLAAAIVVPALAAAYALLAPGRWRTRAWHLGAAAGVLVAVGGAWILAVALTPASERPWISGTSDNSALSLAFGYNGIGRVDGQAGGTSVGGGGGGAFSGEPGLLRLFNEAMGDQGAWLIPLALVGGAVAIWRAARARDRRRLGALVVLAGWMLTAAAVFSLASGIVHTYYVSALAPAVAGVLGAGVVALAEVARRGGLWAVPAVVGIAATAWLQVDLLGRSGYLPWIRAIVILGACAAVAALLAVRLVAARRPSARGRWSAAAVGLALGALLVAPAAWSETTLRAAVNGVFPGAGPSFVRGLATAGGAAGLPGGRPGFGGGAGGGIPDGSGFPGGGSGNGVPGGGPTIPPGGLPGLGDGGPSGGSGGPGRGFGGGRAGGGSATEALAYAKAHGGGGRATLVVVGATSAADLIIEGERVSAIGGFSGRETSESTGWLARLVAAGDVRYVLAGSGGFGGGGLRGDTREDVATTVVTEVCTAVSSVDGLYDCAGKASAIAAARS